METGSVDDAGRKTADDTQVEWSSWPVLCRTQQGALLHLRNPQRETSKTAKPVTLHGPLLITCP